MFGVYDTGPWVAIKMAGNDFPGWIGGGTKNFDFNVKLEVFGLRRQSEGCRSGDTPASPSVEPQASSSWWKME